MEKMKLVDSYIVSFNTYLIEPIKHENKLFSQVYDKTGKVFVSKKPLNIIRKSCRVMGTSYNVARELSKGFFGKRKHKLPIVFTYDFGKPLVYFPILSPNSENNIWIGQHSIINVKKSSDSKDETIVTLKDETELTLQINYASFFTQYGCATLLQKHVANQQQIIRNDFLF